MEFNKGFFYLGVDSQIYSPLHEQETRTESSRREGEGEEERESTFLVPKATPKLDQPTKDHWLKGFPQHRARGNPQARQQVQGLSLCSISSRLVCIILPTLLGQWQHADLSPLHPLPPPSRLQFCLSP